MSYPWIWSADNVKKHIGKLISSGSLSIFGLNFRVPQVFTCMKIHMDAYDCSVNVMQSDRQHILQVEVTPKILQPLANGTEPIPRYGYNTLVSDW